MFDIKPLSLVAIPAALEKARCYRFLNEPVEAESICLDIYEKAIEKRLAGNDDAILRWNACARMIMRQPEMVPPEEQIPEQMLE
jgi:hypothetical protein